MTYAYTRSTALSGAGTTVLNGSAILNSSSSNADISVTFRDDSGIGLTGSPKAAQWIKDAVAGSDSVDVLVIGDSNTDYSAYGYVSGIAKALRDSGVPMYGTMVHNVAKTDNSQNIGYLSNSSKIPSTASGLSVQGTGGTAVYGSASAYTELTGLFGKGSGTMAPEGDAGLDYIVITGSPNFSHGIAGMYINAGNPMVTSELKYRVVAATGPGFGSFQPSYFQTGASPAQGNLTATPTAGASYSWTPYQFTLAASGTRTDASFTLCYTGLGGIGATGTTAFAMQSVFRVTKGFAVGCLHYRGGATMTDMRADIEGSSAEQIGTYLREVCDRQITAGGTGRVIVWIQGGVNIPTSTTFWTDSVSRMKARIEAAWSAAGKDPRNITFVANVSHQRDLSDTSASGVTAMGPIRSAAREMVYGLSGIPNLTIVTINDLLSYYDLVPIYDGGGSVHLTNAGYDAMFRKIVDSMIASIDIPIRLLPGEVVPIGVSSVTLTAGQSCVVLS